MWYNRDMLKCCCLGINCHGCEEFLHGLQFHFVHHLFQFLIICTFLFYCLLIFLYRFSFGSFFFFLLPEFIHLQACGHLNSGYQDTEHIDRRLSYIQPTYKWHRTQRCHKLNPHSLWVSGWYESQCRLFLVQYHNTAIFLNSGIW